VSSQENPPEEVSLLLATAALTSVTVPVTYPTAWRTNPLLLVKSVMKLLAEGDIDVVVVSVRYTCRVLRATSAVAGERNPFTSTVK
jgi:hypothetical protein